MGIANKALKEGYNKITRFTDLIVWQEAHKLVLMVYSLTNTFPDEERYCLTNQLRRAVISITSNIAEGFTRKSMKEKVNLYKVSHGSLVEVQNQLLAARDIGYIKECFTDVADQTVIVHKLINGLLKSTRLRKYEK